MSLPVPSAKDTTIVIGNLKRDIDQEALEGLCRKLGEVISFRVHLLGPTPGSLAAAVVQFSSQEEAKHAVKSFEGRLSSGQPITACIASGGPSHRPPPTATSTPAATSSSPQQAPVTAATAATGGYPRASYPDNTGLKIRNVANATEESSGSSPAFRGYHPQRQPIQDGVLTKSRERWGGGRRGVMSQWPATDHPTSAPRYPTHQAPPGGYDEEYSHQHQHQHQRRPSSGASGAPTAETGHHDMNGADHPPSRAPPPPRYADGREEPDPYAAASEGHAQQWHGSVSRRDESREHQWETAAAAVAADDTSYYTRGGGARGGGRDPQSTYYPATAASSAWPDEVSARSPRHVHRMMPPSGKVPAGAPPPYDMGTHDEGYANDEDPVGAKRARHAMVAATGGHTAPSWGGQTAGYAAKLPPPRAVSSKDEFDKEVMRQAAKMVAERELAAREETRREQEEAWRRRQQQPLPRQGERDNWGKDEPLPNGPRRPPSPMQDDGVEGRDRAIVSKKRDANHDSRELDRRHAPPPHQRDSRDLGGDVDRDGRRDGTKTARQDPSPSGSRTATDNKSDARSAATSATRRDGYRSRGSPASQQRDRGKKLQRDDAPPARAGDDDRARRRGDDRAGKLAPRPYDDSRERERQRNVQKAEARLSPRSMDDKWGEDRGVSRPIKTGTRQQQSDPDREREGERKPIGEGHRAATARQDSRDSRGRSRDNTKNHHNNGDSHASARDWNRESPRDRNGIWPLNPSSPRLGGDHDFHPHGDDGRLGKKRAADDWIADKGRRRAPPAYTHLGSPDNSTILEESSTADTGWHVFVKGISISTTFTDLAQRFAAFGDVNGLKAIFNQVACRTEREGSRASGQAVVMASAGFAFISFDNEEGMLKAIEGMNDQVVDGNVLKVCRGRGTRGSGFHRYGPDRSDADRKVPDRNLSDRKVPDRNFPNRKGPDRNVPNRRDPNQNVPDYRFPERTGPDRRVQESSPTEKLERALKAPRRTHPDPQKQQSKAKHEQPSPTSPSPGSGKEKKESTNKGGHTHTSAGNGKRANNPKTATTTSSTTTPVGPRIAAAAASVVAAAASAAAANKKLSSPSGSDHRKRPSGVTTTAVDAAVPSSGARNSNGGGGGHSRDKRASAAGDSRSKCGGGDGAGGPGDGKDARDRDRSGGGDDSKLKRSGSART